MVTVEVVVVVVWWFSLFLKVIGENVFHCLFKLLETATCFDPEHFRPPSRPAKVSLIFI